MGSAIESLRQGPNGLPIYPQILNSLGTVSPPVGRSLRYSGLGSSLVLVDELTAGIRGDRNQERGARKEKALLDHA
jgi:hypothetical protein